MHSTWDRNWHRGEFFEHRGFFDRDRFFFPSVSFGWWGGPYWYDPFWWNAWYWNWPSYYYYNEYAQAYDRGTLASMAKADMGALALKIKPKDTEVYVNGRSAGESQNYGGNPGYLWLKGGTYTLSFYKPGYQTITGDFTVQPGAVIKVKQHMEKGPSTPPGKGRMGFNPSNQIPGSEKSEEGVY